jgi:hypothetical protein
MKSLLTTTALFEGATGIALLVIPYMVVPFLLGIPFSEPGLSIVSGITGAALITLAIANWLYRNTGLQAIMMVKSILFYNLTASLVLLYGGLALHLPGIGLWPAFIVHVGLAIWCIFSLLEARKNAIRGTIHQS